MDPRTLGFLSGPLYLASFLDPDVDFAGVLRAIAGPSGTCEIDKEDMNLEDFLELVADEKFDGLLVTPETPDDWLLLLEPDLYQVTQPTEVFEPGLRTVQVIR